MNERQTCFQLNELARRLRSVPPAPHNPNLYFVMVGGNVVLATTIFNVANNLFESYVQARSKDSAVLADRRIGDLANYYPATGLSLDARNTDYYQQQKWGLNDEQFAKLKAERDASIVASKEAARIDKPGQWIVRHGNLIDLFFYVQTVQRNGKLRGLLLELDHRNKTVGECYNLTLSNDDLPNWKVAYIETVRALKLDRYLA